MKKGEFLLFSTIFCNPILNFCVKIRTRFYLRDKRLFEIIEVEIMRVDCICKTGGHLLKVSICYNRKTTLLEGLTLLRRVAIMKMEVVFPRSEPKHFNVCWFNFTRCGITGYFTPIFGQNG